MAKLDLGTVTVMAFNFVSSTAIVFVNKILFRSYGFNYSTFVTACHFVATTLGVVCCEQLGMFQPKKLNHLDVLPMTAAFCGFVVFNNLSLQYNSIGFYQLMKVLTTPVIALLQFAMFGIVLDRRLAISLIPVILGVILATVTDFSFNFTGFFWAVAGVLSTSFYQIFVKSKQDSLGANSFQLLKYQAPQAALIVFLITPFLDNITGPGGLLEFFQEDGAWLRNVQSDSAVELDHDVSTTMIMLLISCFLAFCVNLSIFLVVGRTSPISYNVLGHAKLIVILTGGLVFFNGDSNPKRLFGMFLALVGIIWYTHLKQSIGNAWDARKAQRQSNEDKV